MAKLFFISNSLLDKPEGFAASNAGADVQFSIATAASKLPEVDISLCDCSQTGLIERKMPNIQRIYAIKCGGLVRRFSPIVLIKLLILLIKERPDVVGIYNLYFQQILAIIFYKCLFKKKCFIILQDYRCGELFTLRQRIVDKSSTWFLRFFNICVPITDTLGNIVPLPPEKKFVFRGGKTIASEALYYAGVKVSTAKLENRAVFAGYLSEYNGVDRLLEYWSLNSLNCSLIIFGDGPLRRAVEEAAGCGGRITYGGSVSHASVLSAMNTSKFNICLRYPTKIDAQYFYPSKFFMGLAAKSIMLYNDFAELNEEFRYRYPFVLKDDLSNLNSILENLNGESFSAVSEIQNSLYRKQDSYEHVLTLVLDEIGNGAV